MDIIYNAAMASVANCQITRGYHLDEPFPLDIALNISIHQALSWTPSSKHGMVLNKHRPNSMIFHDFPSHVCLRRWRSTSRTDAGHMICAPWGCQTFFGGDFFPRGRGQVWAILLGDFGSSVCGPVLLGEIVDTWNQHQQGLDRSCSDKWLTGQTPMVFNCITAVWWCGLSHMHDYGCPVWIDNRDIIEWFSNVIHITTTW